MEVASHADEAVDAVRVAAEAVSHADEAADALRAAEKATDQAQSFLRTIDRAPTNPRNYELRLGDVTDGGSGLSTVANPPVSPDTLLRETGRSRAIQIPTSDIPEGLQWVKTEGHYGNPILDNNHWELWAPTQYGSMSPAQYVAWWNSQVAPELARRAGNWSIFK